MNIPQWPTQTGKGCSCTGLWEQGGGLQQQSTQSRHWAPCSPSQCLELHPPRPVCCLSAHPPVTSCVCSRSASHPCPVWPGIQCPNNHHQYQRTHPPTKQRLSGTRMAHHPTRPGHHHLNNNKQHHGLGSRLLPIRSPTPNKSTE